ncbi:MAG TPA: aldo/keto reductase [Phycisphaerales bacterium]|nr:aldo/keto reductase [Phycisphaerales bacterium]
MIRRELGRTGIVCSVLGLGTVKLGRNTGVKYPVGFELPGDDLVQRLLSRAVELGLDILDTAPAYGSSEERLGRLLSGQRDRWSIITKCGERFNDGRSSFDFSPQGVRGSVEESLRKLRTDRVEVLLVHSDGQIETHMPDELWRELAQLKKAGKVRAIGVSTKTVNGARLCMDHCDVLMLTLHSGYLDELPVIAQARDRGVGVLIKKALDSGHGKDPAASLRMVVDTAGVTSAIVGTLRVEHLEANCRAVSGPPDRGENAPS